MIYAITFLILLILITSTNFKYQKTMKKELTQEDKDIILELIANQAICEPEILTEETRFEQDLTLDSLDIVELVMRVEQEFNIHIADSDIEDCKTVGQLFNLVSERL